MVRALILAAAALPFLPSGLFAQAEKEISAKSRIVSLGLFKNGLAVVKREVKVDGAGMYRLDDVPDAIHGTFWIESNAKVEAFLKKRDVPVPEDQIQDGSLQEIFQGKKVTVFFNGSKMPPATGTVPKMDKRARADDPQPNRFFVLKTAKGFMYINVGEVAAVETDEAGAKAMRSKATLILAVGKSEKAPVVHVSYLANGLAWAPSYQLDVSDPKKMGIEFATVVRNELSDFADAEISLISGYPSIEFAHVASPLQAQTSWQRFFQEIARPSGGGDFAIFGQGGRLTNNFHSTARSITLGAIPAGEGVDLHFQPIGKRSLKQGEALSLTIDTGKTDYERIIEWNVTRPVGDLGLREASKDDMWDVLAFKNPFKFPLTTAPAMIVADGRFNGQRTCFWTNAGEETRVKVTRSLSIRTSSMEELDKARSLERVAVGRRDYSKIYIKGELKLNNHRKEVVKVHVAYNARGIIDNASAGGRLTLLPGSLTDVNPVNEVLWVVTLNPGEEKQLTYSYSTLVER